MKKTRIQIGVIGPDKGSYPSDSKMRERLELVAEQLGRLIARSGAVLFTGGTGGAMESASRGAKREGGLVVGTPGNKRGSANQFVDVEIITPLEVGNFVYTGLPSCDAIIVLPGGAGTLSELCLAYRMRKPCVIMRGFNKNYDGFIEGYLDNSKTVRLLGASTPREAVALALKGIRKRARPVRNE